MNTSTKQYWLARAREMGLRVHAGMTAAQLAAAVTGRPQKDRNANCPLRRLRRVVGVGKFGE